MSVKFSGDSYRYKLVTRLWACIDREQCDSQCNSFHLVTAGVALSPGMLAVSIM